MALRSAVWMGCVLAAALGCGFFSGCGDDGAPVTAQNSKFRPTDAPAKKGENPEDFMPPTDVPQGAPSEGTAPTENPGAIVSIPGEASKGTEGTTTPPNTTPATKGQTPAGADDVVVSKEVEQYLQMIRQLASADPPGNTPEEQVSFLIQARRKIVELASTILKAPADARVHQYAVQQGQVALQELMQLGDPSAITRMTLYAELVANHPSEEVAKMGKIMQFRVGLIELIQNGNGKVDPKVLLEKQAALLKDGGDNAEVFGAASSVFQLLAQTGETKAAAEGMRAVAQAFEKSEHKELIKAAKSLPDSARVLELDLPKVLEGVLEKKEGAEDKLVADLTSLLAEKNPNPMFIQAVMDVLRPLESIGKAALVEKLYGLLETAYSTHDNPEATRFVTEQILTPGRKRYALVGKPFEPKVVTVDGQPLDPATLKGKVVLVSLWGTFAPPSYDQFPILRKLQDDLKDKGLVVVAFSVDPQLTDLADFLQYQQKLIPFSIYRSPEVTAASKLTDWHETSLAKEYGAANLPLYILVGKDGKVDSIHHFKLDQERTGERLKALLDLKEVPILAEKPKPMIIENPTLPKAEPVPAAPPPSAPGPAPAAPPAEPAPPAKKQGFHQPLRGLRDLERSFVSLLSPGLISVLAADEETKPGPAKTEPLVIPEGNPYLAKPDRTPGQLSEWVAKMLDKSVTIQRRPGFTAAVVDACDRILAENSGAREAERLAAIENKLEVLHRAACAGDDAADKQLAAFVAQLKDDSRPRVARAVPFFVQEQRILTASQAEDSKPEEVSKLLGELLEYFSKEKLAARHLRMASSTVELINKLDDGDEREEHFTNFGKVFGQSTSKELSRYGKRLAKKPGLLESDLIGKPLVVAGTTFEGNPFSWEKYRGKVVIVDFWATWCGPCRREMPNLQKLHTKLKDQGFEVVGVSVDRELEDLETYLEQHKLPWDNLAGEEALNLADKYGVRSFPTMMLVDQEGLVVAVGRSSAALRSEAEKLLKKNAAKE